MEGGQGLACDHVICIKVHVQARQEGAGRESKDNVHARKQERRKEAKRSAG